MGKRSAVSRFPVARIKKLIQADKDVGKVSQATPVLISKALELFIGSLVEATVDETRKGGARKVMPYHLRRTVHHNEMFDFLKDIVAKVPDPLTDAGAAGPGAGGSSRRTSAPATKSSGNGGDDFDDADDDGEEKADDEDEEEEEDAEEEEEAAAGPSSRRGSKARRASAAAATPARKRQKTGSTENSDGAPVARGRAGEGNRAGSSSGSGRGRGAGKSAGRGRAGTGRAAVAAAEEVEADPQLDHAGAAPAPASISGYPYPPPQGPSMSLTAPHGAGMYPNTLHPPFPSGAGGAAPWGSAGPGAWATSGGYGGAQHHSPYGRREEPVVLPPISALGSLPTSTGSGVTLPPLQGVPSLGPGAPPAWASAGGRPGAYGASAAGRRPVEEDDYD